MSNSRDPQLELLGALGDVTARARRTPSASRQAVRKPALRFGEQAELFPRALHVDELDPRQRLGTHTGVQRLFRVRWDDERRGHLVFVDRHGTYCEEHGAACPAVRAVTERTPTPPGRRPG